MIILSINILQQQDHYKVLGLGKLRHKATLGDIKKACMFSLILYRADLTVSDEVVTDT